VLKAVVRANQNIAGIYGAVIRTGRPAVGQAIILYAAGERRKPEVVVPATLQPVAADGDR
jgi:hypothetical protein